MQNVNPMDGGCRFSDLIYKKVIKKQPVFDSLLELGCGVGGNLNKFKTIKRRVGIDPHKPNIKHAKNHIKGCEFILGNHLEMQKFSENEFDVGITCSVLDHIEDLEEALNLMTHVCAELILIEPIKKNVNRQAKKRETGRWQSTWYHDYETYFKNINMDYHIVPCPLYKTNSGPHYHLIYVCTK